MAGTPYAPTPFASPVVAPAAGGAGVPTPYLSNSQYIYAPTAMDTTNLVPGGSAADQTQVLADTLRRASGWVDKVCFGADAASKGASLCASISVESDRVPVTGGEIRLVCDYKPIIQVNGIDLGYDMSSLSPLGSGAAAALRLGRRTIYVPCGYSILRSGDSLANVGAPRAGRVTAVWSYVNGYPHTSLASPAAGGATTLDLVPTDGASGLLGLVPGATVLRIADGSSSESVLISAVDGTTVTIAAPLRSAHTPPAPPDFLPVTALPPDIEQAAIFMATALIKTRGDNSLVLAEITEPHEVKEEAGDEFTDVKLALKMLTPYRVRVKAPR